MRLSLRYSHTALGGRLALTLSRTLRARDNGQVAVRWRRRAVGQSGRNGVEVKALVSPVGKGGQVARAVFGEIERMVGSTCARFTAQNRVS